MTTQKFTNGVTLTDAPWFDDVDTAAYSSLNTVSGTNTITAVGPASMTAYASGQKFWFIPSATNTGATTINLTCNSVTLGAKNIFFNGAACVGGEIRIGVPVCIFYDGTQFNITGTSPTSLLTLGTPQATTAGTSIDFTAIPAWVKKITVQFVGVSTNGADNWLIQIGDSGGIENSGYLGSGIGLSNAGAVAVTNFTTGFGLGAASASNVGHGSVVLTMENASAFTWVASGNVALSDSASFLATAGSKSLSAALDRVRLTTTGGTNTFDAGAVNILYE